MFDFDKKNKKQICNQLSILPKNLIKRMNN